MNPGGLRALEFDRIVEAVCRYAQTPPGEARLAGLRPETDSRTVSRALDATAETAAFLAEGQIGLRAPADLLAIVDALGVEGRALEPLQLLGLASFLASLEATCGAIRRARVPVPYLRGIADSTSSFERELADIARKLDPGGEVVDDASPELKSVRDRLRKQRARLRGTLESYLRGKDTSKYLQQQIVTDRNGRYVLVVRSEFRSAIPGIVHGSSGSGASLFLEPLSTVEINNDIVALEQQEAEEVHRILLALTDAFRQRSEDVRRTLAAATEVDVVQARAQFSRAVDGVRPKIAEDGRLELRAARHPLLIPAVRRHLGEVGGQRNAEGDLSASGQRPASSDVSASGSSGSGSSANGQPFDSRERPLAQDRRSAASPPARAVSGARFGEASPELDAGSSARRAEAGGPVPVDILMIPPVQVLVITGPNTGGKTVALKTAGLLSLMAQAGLLIPAADGSQVPVFKSVFADIGDEQSIAASLSTFSAHIANIVMMDRSLDLPALVLLDEAGAGTDPVEGGALAMAMIDHFRRRGAMAIATTHYDSLKSYASTTEGVMAAGFGFDPQTFAPTYRLNYGSPGSSLALEIASRLGMPADVIEQARAHRSARESQLAEHLAKIEREAQALEHERRLSARERETLAETAAKLQAREHDLRNREETFRRRLDERIDERLREARREIDAVVDALKARTDSLASEADRRAARLVPTGQSGAARADARAATEAIGERLKSPDAAAATTAEPHPGRVAAVGDRVVVGAFGLEGIVQAIHDREAEIDVRGKRMRAKVDELRVLTPSAPQAPPKVRVNVELQPREGMLTELRSVRLIHGYGTGQLRRAIAGFLQSHPFVAHFAPAPPEQGGGGVTVVELKE
jgi:DNA mismatch repair protein MutS2